jgi:hypothetical protein
LRSRGRMLDWSLSVRAQRVVRPLLSRPDRGRPFVHERWALVAALYKGWGGRPACLTRLIMRSRPPPTSPTDLGLAWATGSTTATTIAPHTPHRHGIWINFFELKRRLSFSLWSLPPSQKSCIDRVLSPKYSSLDTTICTFQLSKTVIHPYLLERWQPRMRRVELNIWQPYTRHLPYDVTFIVC